MSEQARSAVPLTAAPDKVKTPSRQKLRRLISKFGSSLSGVKSKTSAPGLGHSSSSHRWTQTADGGLIMRLFMIRDLLNLLPSVCFGVITS